jgi:hypothetical protein
LPLDPSCDAVEIRPIFKEASVPDIAAILFILAAFALIGAFISALAKV